MTPTADARAAFFRVLDRIERENRDPSPAENRLLSLAFQHLLDCHFPRVVTTLRGILLDIKRVRPSERATAVVSVKEWRRKLARVP